MTQEDVEDFPTGFAFLLGSGSVASTFDTVASSARCSCTVEAEYLEFMLPPRREGNSLLSLAILGILPAVGSADPTACRQHRVSDI